VGLWYTRSGDPVSLKHWDGESTSLAFDAESGETHLLEPLSFEILRLVDASSPCSHEYLVKELTPLIDSEKPVDVGALIDSCLKKLESTGLVKQQPH